MASTAYKQRPGNMLLEPTPIEGQLEHEVERIEDMRNINGRIEYLVRWSGYSPAENSWEPSEHLTNSQKLIAQYIEKHGEAPVTQRGRKSRGNVRGRGRNRGKPGTKGRDK